MLVNMPPLERRRLLVRMTKWMLAVFVVLMLAVLAWYGLVRQEESRFRLSFADVRKQDDLPPVMIKPRLEGQDKQGQPYVVTADSAMQQGPNLVDLQKIRAELTTKQGNWLTMMARTGQYDVRDETLLIRGDIALYMDNGLEFATESALVDLKGATIRGEDPVSGQAMAGTLDAGGFEADSVAGAIRFTAPVKMMLYPAAIE